ncbi:MAG: 30S ribosomal protein S1 [Candidatus Omnitrophica bacterium]|nr:30S ribosomal protein S1 [Candidatus Omnitrophota bacterium]MCM8806384.1 30S ribosomal protein S1 [Candidatus Omnitrophota bacterium]
MVKEQVNKLLEEKIASFKPGSLVKGKIINIMNEEVVIDIGFKSEGITPRDEFKGKKDNLQIGEEVFVVIDSLEPDSNGFIPLSKEKADILLNWEKIEEKYKSDLPIEGVIFKRVKGGYRVDIGVTAFLPSSQTDIVPIKNPNEYIGLKSFFKILKLDSLRKNIVVSRKKYLEEEKERQKIEYLKNLSKNQLVSGIVKNIVDYGAFIEIEYGIIGLLHINDMSWGRISHPSQILTVGEKIEVVVLDVDMEKQVVSFGLKQKTPNPWDRIEEKYPVGSIVEGKVVNITDYGAFIKLEEGVEGLLHISELSWTGRIKHPSEILATGDTVKVKVIDIKKDEQKISFSLKQLEPNPWPEIIKKYPVGSIVTGRVCHITDFGAFVELEKGIDGLLHISNISNNPIKHPSEVLRKGQKVDVMILEVDPENRKISLGMKQIENKFKTHKGGEK